MLKKAQAAMEFLMTYGWAILAVLITIASLAYFGVLNPARFLPQSCTLFPGVACTDITVNNAGVSLVVQNGLGQNLNTFTVNIPGCTASSADNGLADGEKETIVLSCNPFLITNSRFKNDIDITYTSSGTSLSHTRKGSIVSQVENDYVLNGNFESKASIVTTIPFWVCTLGPYRVYSLDASSGLQSLLHDSTAPSQSCLSTNFIPIDINKDYKLCASYKVLSTPINQLIMQLTIYNSGGVALSLFDIISQSNPPISGWQRVCGTISTFPVGATQIKIIFYGDYNAGGTSTGDILVDDITLTDA